MSHLPSLALRQKLHAEASLGMARQLRGLVDGPGLMKALRWGVGEVDRTLEETSKAVKATIACRAGCSACCSVPVDVQAHEVLFAADFIQTHFSPEALAAVIETAGAYRARLQGLTGEQRSADLKPCPLLRDGSCSIYEGRPEICRAHHTRDASVCAAYLTDPSVDLEAVYIPPLRARLYAVMLGLDQALEDAGYDDRSYDFSAALHEALTNSLCLTLWLRKRPAFPDACLSPEFAEE